MKYAVVVLAIEILLSPVSGAQELTFRHFSGSNGGPGAIDGPVASARLNMPGCVAVDAAGNVYFSDTGNNTIRMVEPSGVVTTLAGLAGNAGSSDGRGSAAQFNEPRGIVIEGAGNLLVADSGNHTIRRVSPSGVVTTLAGQAGEAGLADGAGSQARFASPWALARDMFGHFLVADYNNGRIRRITSAGVVTTLTDQFDVDAGFSRPAGVAMDPLGNVFVAESASKHTIAMLTPAGVLTTFAGTPWHFGSGDGPGSVAQFKYPTGVAIDAAGNLLVSDAGNGTIRRVTPEGVVTTIAGVPEEWGVEDGTGTAARFEMPGAVALDLTGNLIVADVRSFTLRRVSPAAVVTTIAGRARKAGSSDGPAAQALFRNPAGVAFDRMGNAYVADAGNSTVRKVTPEGVVSTLAGLAGASGSEDGTGSAARFAGPDGIAVDASGNVLVTETWGHTLRRITPEGVVTTLAGSAGSAGSSDGAGSAARFSSPAGVAVDTAGNVYVADTGNYRIRRVTAQGVVTTLTDLVTAPGEPGAGGPASSFSNPRAIAVDAAGFVYVADSADGTIRKVSPAGIVTTLAGSAGALGDRDGLGSAARFGHPIGMSLDAEGNLWIADRGYSTIRRVSPSGNVTTAAGRASGLVFRPSTAGDRVAVDGTGPGARFNDPWGIAVGPGGTVLVSDATDHGLRVGEPALADVATIDAPAGPVGAGRQLGTAPQTATGWLWEPVRIESRSTANVEPSGARDPVFTPNVDGLFVFRLTASNGSGSRISTVALAAGSVSPTATLSERRDSCLGSSVELRADLTGTPPWTLGWSDGYAQSLVATSPAIRLVSPDVSTTYSVSSVSDARGPGTASGSSIVTVRTPPTVVVSGSASTCAGSTISVNAELAGTPPITLVWSDGLTERLFMWTGRHYRAVAPTSTTTYTVTSISDSYCTGSASGSATITTKPLPTATVSGSTTICAGQSTELRAELTGTAPWKVVWSDGFIDNGVSESPARRVVAPSETTTFTVTSVQDAACTSSGAGSATVTVLTQTPPVASVSTPSPVVPGATGLQAFVPDGGVGATYAWTISNGAITAGQGTAVITYTAGSAGPCVLGVAVGVPGACAASGSTTVWVGAEPAPPLDISHLAGTDGGAGWFDGPSDSARFGGPTGIVVDGAGNSFIADSYSHTVRRMTPGGVVTTLAGTAGVIGSSDGTGSAAQFWYPWSPVLDSDGNLYVVDTYNHTVRKVSPAGVVTTLAGTAGIAGSDDGVGGAARFRYPIGLAIDGSGNLFVSDNVNATIRKITAGGVVSTIAGSPMSYGTADGTGSAARFHSPAGMALDPAGNLYVADQGRHTIRKVTPDRVVTTVAGAPGTPGSADGSGYSARFRSPASIAADDSGGFWVSDAGNATVRWMTASGDVTTIAGAAGIEGAADGSGSEARFASPGGFASVGPGVALMTDLANQTIRKVTAAGAVTTVAGKAAEKGLVDGFGPSARFLGPSDVGVDASGNAYVAEPEGHSIRKVTPAGEVSTLAGLGGTWGGVDGTGSDSRFHTPSGVAVDGTGNVFVADKDNHAIRRVTPAGEVTTLAGRVGVRGYSDGTGRAATFNGPTGVAVDGEGNVYVADRSNHVIRKVTPGGFVSTLAGVPFVSGATDGPARTARFSSPRDVAVDGRGNVYVADTANSTIRKLTPEGEVTTLAGVALVPGTDDGTGASARFQSPTGLAMDGSGNVWVSDSVGSTIRRVTPAGVVTTLAGSRGIAGSVDGTGLAAQFYEPFGVAVGYSGEILVSDSRNRAIRRGVAALPDVAVIDASSGPPLVTRQLGASPRTATTWRWELVRAESGSVATLSSTSIPDPTFTPDLPGFYRFRLTASDGIRRSATFVSLAVGLSPPTATIAGSTTQICAASYAPLEARLTGTPPWDVVWSDGLLQPGLTTASATRRVSPSVTTTYTVLSVADATGPGIASGSAVVEVKPRPDLPVLTAPLVVGAESPHRKASVPAHSGSTYSWWLVGGSITAGWDTNEVEFRAGSSVGAITLQVQEKFANGCWSPVATAPIAVLPVGSAMLFYPVTPCRILDTRDPQGQTFGHPISAGSTAVVSAGDECGLPRTVRAIAANVTATQPTADGFLSLYDAEPAPPTSTVHFAAGRTRAAGSLVKLSNPGAALSIHNVSAGATHVILDVTGYFE